VVLDGRSFSLSLGLFFVFVLLAAGVRVMCFRPSVVAFLFPCFTYVFLYVTSVFFTSVFCVFRCGFVLGGCGGWRRRRFIFGGGRTTTKKGFDSTFFFALIALLSAIEVSVIVSLWL
jgi:hypothetical protein